MYNDVTYGMWLPAFGFLFWILNQFFIKGLLERLSCLIPSARRSTQEDYPYWSAVFAGVGATFVIAPADTLKVVIILAVLAMLVSTVMKRAMRNLG